ncbi:MAG: hypothetical protein SFU86_07615, partial [Pirellulaceae bacterium]|nr:hypothetical protein [Pirellulaceae bacterium]
MKAPKVSLDGAKIQALLFQHVEKIVLVVVVALVGWFVYQGYILEGLPPDRTPPLLVDTANNVTTFINSPTRWNDVKEEPERFAPMDVVPRVDKAQLPNLPEKYATVNRLSLPDFAKRQFRTDPKIFPPIHLKVVPISGPLAVYTEGTEVDPLDQTKIEAPPAATLKTKVPKTTRKPRTKAPRGGEGAMGGEGGPLGRGPIQPNPQEPFGQQGPVMQAQSLYPESIRGYQAEGEGAIARDVKAMVVMAVVPIDKQIQEFENALASSLDYDSARDLPQYLAYTVERADVTANPAADPATLKWDSLSAKGALKETEKWEGVLTEIVDPSYLLPDVLTHPAPPLMQRDIWELLTHPDVPLATVNLADEAAAPVEDVVPTDDVPGGPVPNPVGGGVDGTGPVGPRMMPRPGQGEGGLRGPRRPPVQGGGENDGMGQFKPVAPPKYQLIRFTDTTVQTGKQYRYRLKVFLHDPNHPAATFTPPSVVSLRDDVRQRVKDQDVADAKKGGGFRTYWVTSDWSEASAPATLPTTRHYFAGKVTPPKDALVITNMPKVPITQVSGKGLIVVWASDKVVDVPAEFEFYRGSVVNFSAPTQVIHPVTHQIIDLTYPMRTDAIVVDMQGGEKIPTVDRRMIESALESPGEILYFDSTGQLHARDEATDIEGYRTYFVPKPEVKPMTTPELIPSGGGEGGLGGLL